MDGANGQTVIDIGKLPGKPLIHLKGAIFQDELGIEGNDYMVYATVEYNTVRNWIVLVLGNLAHWSRCLSVRSIGNNLYH